MLKVTITLPSSVASSRRASSVMPSSFSFFISSAHVVAAFAKCGSDSAAGDMSVE